MTTSSDGQWHRPLLSPAGRHARYLKGVDVSEKTLRFWQEIYDDQDLLVEVHENDPVDIGHRRIREDWEMAITRETMAHKLAAYFHHEIFLADDVDHGAIRGGVARLRRCTNVRTD
jgi:hypothetical protein